jgi:hypothetical protein
MHKAGKPTKQCVKVGKLTGMEWKRVTVSCAVYDEYLIMATECGTLNLLRRYESHVIDTVQESQPITAMCHVSEYFILMAHEGGYLSCWDLQENKFKMKHMIKNLAAGEISRITRSPNSQEREAVIASNRGCIFVRVSDQGYIVEELFEIYFNNKPLNYVGFT